MVSIQLMVCDPQFTSREVYTQSATGPFEAPDSTDVVVDSIATGRYLDLYRPGTANLSLTRSTNQRIMPVYT